MSAATILRSFLAPLAFLALLTPARAETPALQTNQSYVEDVTRPASLNVDDLMSVFGYVMSQLPERVKVYPTENYYYVGFFHNGIRYAGNIRLDASNRDDGKVIFAYFEDTSQWYDGAPDKHAVLDAAQGVTVEKVEPLVYRVTYQGKSVVFALNDLRNVKPPAGALGADEKFLGPIFDESAIPFYLVFNTRLKIFHYVLDEREKVADVFFSPKGKDRILVGKRTGFAFYKDHQLEPENPDRRLRREHACQQLLRRPVRPASRQLHRRRGAARRHSRGAAAAQGRDRPLRRCAGRQHPLHDRPVHALSGAERSRSHRRLRAEEAEAAGLLSLLCQR